MIWDDVEETAKRIIDECIEHKQPATTRSVVDSLIEEIDFKRDADLVRHCIYETMRAKVRTLIQATTPTRQMVIPGMEHVQRVYNLKGEDGELKVVPIELATDKELLSKAKELRTAGITFMKHADELERYVAQRQNPIEPPRA